MTECKCTFFGVGLFSVSPAELKRKLNINFIHEHAVNKLVQDVLAWRRDKKEGIHHSVTPTMFYLHVMSSQVASQLLLSLHSGTGFLFQFSVSKCATLSYQLLMELACFFFLFLFLVLFLNTENVVYACCDFRVIWNGPLSKRRKVMRNVSTAVE